MEQLHTCPLHLKLMPTTSLLHILHNEETRDDTTFFAHSWKKIAPKRFRLFDLKFVSQSVVTCHVAYTPLLTTPFVVITAQNSSQHFKLSIIGH